jgi:precorrin-6B methylase 2
MSKRKPAWIAFTVVVMACCLWAAAFFAWWWFHEAPSQQPVVSASQAPLFWQFMDEWGGLVGCALTIWAAALIGYIPSSLDRKVDRLEERLQSQVHDFGQFHRKTLELLVSLKDDEQSQFSMLAASPILGIELSSTSQEWLTFERHVLYRLQSTRQTTTLICMDDATLQLFCRAMAQQYLGEPGREAGLAAAAREQIALARSTCRAQSARVRRGALHSAQIVIASPGNPSYPATAVVFYATTAAISAKEKLRGFYTTDPQQVEFIKHVFKDLEAASGAAMTDGRTEPQKLRDKELLHALSGPQDSPTMLRLPGTQVDFRLAVQAGVFPPHLELAYAPLLDALDETVKLLWTGVDPSRRLGIDVGTGSGIFAVILAQSAGKVFATDIMPEAVENARQNLAAYKSQSGREFEYQCTSSDLLVDVPLPAGGQIPLIVFNHPLYASIHNVFGVGGSQGGAEIVTRFLRAALPYVKDGGGVLMPECAIAGLHGPSAIARECGYKPNRLAVQSHSKYGECAAYLFTVSSPS